MGVGGLTVVRGGYQTGKSYRGTVICNPVERKEEEKTEKKKKRRSKGYLGGYAVLNGWAGI